ncbi:MAG: Fe-S cluster assembly protein SufD [Hamadaea sp.]|uniref:Fe-S cluster assembly protein SufD n=1 Tax=Hamadaea sp. TaxID=2024425 RepID=UPI0017F459CF|nr:Fe-S cluster assembly protein SufD [Hamadaea sp.]NUR51206.1 Fe-S cluster assembly protein SufD [Hamadaea sp.]NUR80962.1 Fe-S cluster assembly protein SufD [Dermatophilaceae bacterium]NUT23875.1 Fe-S cluster assembly protein SufD [Hamadaea sp.]
MTTLANSAPPKTKSQALRSYDVADFPALTGLEEEWRFTPLKRLRGLATETVPAATGAAPKYELPTLPAGVTVTSVGRDDARLGSVLTPFDRISALAYAGFENATLIKVANEATPAEPIQVRLVGGGAEGIAYGHTFVEIGALAEATLILEHTGSATLADNVEISVGSGAHLTLVTVADWARDAVQAQHLKFRLGRDAKVLHVQVSLGGDLVRQYTSVEYADRGGDMSAYGLYFATEGQHLEHRLLVDHAVPDCRSYVGYRGALQGEQAHTVWVGDVLIRAEATGTDTYEINRNLLLSDGARADSVPNLEIETGEVAGAGHASATGRFDDEHLFYLMARGIPEDEARKLVVRGFFAELLAKIPVPELHDRLGDVIEARLQGASA